MPAELGRIVSNSAVDAAGAALVGYDPHAPGDHVLWDAIDIIGQWRGLHARPLARVAAELAEMTGLDPAQRLKRIGAIIAKIDRVPRFGARLSSMQDIGGCRLVLPTQADVVALVQRCREGFKSGALRVADHTAAPSLGGYRSVHLVCSVTPEAGSRRHERIEIQIRSAAQDAWATAVETAGRIVGQDLKSGRGDDSWLRFFAYVSNAIALREGTAPVPGAPQVPGELRQQIILLASRLNAMELLQPRDFHVERVPQTGGKYLRYYVVSSDAFANTASVDTYKPSDLWLALTAYAKAEKEAAASRTAQAVTIAATSYGDLRKRYPAYFGATAPFIQLLLEATAGETKPL